MASPRPDAPRPAAPDLRVAVLVLLLLGPLLASGPAAADHADEATARHMFFRPAPIQTISYDPWFDAVWLGTAELGLVLKPLDDDTVALYGPRDGLPGTAVHTVVVRQADVWVGTSVGPAVIDKRDQTVRLVRTTDGAPLQAVTRTVFFEGDVAWIGTDRSGLFKVDPATLIATPQPDPITRRPFDTPVMGLAARGQELFISVAAYGLVRWDRDTGLATLHDDFALADRPLYGRLLLVGGDLWIGTSGDGALRFDLRTSTFRHYASPFNLNARSVGDIERFGQEIWFATDAGVSVYDVPADHWYRYDGAGDTPFPAPRPHDLQVIDGVMYAATSEGQVVRNDRATRTWTPMEWFDPARMPGWNVILDCDPWGDRIMFATGGGGATVYDPGDGSWTRFGTATGHPPDVAVFAVASNASEAWFATGRGLAGWRRAADTWEYHRTDDRILASGVMNRIEDVAVDEGGVWAGALSQRNPWRKGAEHWAHGGLAHRSSATGAWRLWNATHGLSSDNITAVLPDGARVWVGGHGGIDVFDKATTTFRHVFPTTGPTEDSTSFLRLGDRVWAGVSVTGLLSIDATTLQVRAVPEFARMTVTSLADAGDGRIWVGTGGKGVYLYEPATATVTAFTSGQPTDIWAHCLLPHGDVLFVGSQWAVQRLHIPTKRWLPLGPTPFDIGLPGTRDPHIRIETPSPGTAVALGETVNLTGTAHAPVGARVEARLGTGTWYRGTGVESWSAAVPVRDVSTGPVPLTVRVRFDGRTMAQTVTTVEVTTGTGTVTDPTAGPRPTLRHTPVLEVTTGAPVKLVVDSDDLPDDATAEITWSPLDDDATRIPMTRRGTAFAADVDAPAAPTTIAYAITVRWPGGQAHLPEPGAGYGSAYRLAVRESAATARPVLVGPESIQPDADRIGVARVTVQNPGSVPLTVRITYGDAAAAWADGPAALDVAALASATFDVTVTVPASETSERALSIRAAAPDGRDDQITVRVLPTADTPPEARGRTPAPAPFFALVAVAAAALARRRD